MKKEADDLVLKCIKAQEAEETHGTPTEDNPNGNTNQTRTTLLITDSNGKRVKPKLPRNENIEWLHVKGVYRATDIPEKLEIEENKRHLNKADSFLLMIGLNEIRDGMKATEAIKSIECNIQQLVRTEKPICIVEIPPVADSISNRTEARMLNNLLERMSKKYENVQITKTWEILTSYAPKKIFEENDMYHLDREKIGTTRVAEIIVAHIKKVHKDPPAKTLTTVNIDIEQGTAGHYIGAGGKTLKRIINDNTVNIVIPRDTNQVIITGTEENVKRARIEIEDITKSIENRSSKENQNNRRKSEVPCSFFSRGRCNKGETCEFKHDHSERQESSSTQKRVRNYEENSDDNDDNTPERYSRNRTRHENTRRDGRSRSNHRDRSRPNLRSRSKSAGKHVDQTRNSRHTNQYEETRGQARDQYHEGRSHGRYSPR